MRIFYGVVVEVRDFKKDPYVRELMGARYQVQAETPEEESFVFYSDSPYSPGEALRIESEEFEWTGVFWHLKGLA